MNRRISAQKKAYWRAAVYELAKCLYIAHVKGWQSLSLNSSYTRPTNLNTPANYGYITYEAYLPIGNVLHIRAMVTTLEYERSLAGLSSFDRSEIESYYKRGSSHGVIPDLEHHYYRKTYDAFHNLLVSLIANDVFVSKVTVDSQKTT